jgi:hypothetical protein
MIWLALLLLGCGVVDVTNRPAVPRHLPEGLGAVAVVLVGLLAGQTTPGAILGLLLVVLGVVAWRWSASAAVVADRPWLPLLVLAVSVVLTLSVSGLADPVDGALAGWWSGLSWPLAEGVGAERALLVLGVLLVQLSTGNVVVRLVLATTRTIDPSRRAVAEPDPALDIKGGRLLIVGLGLAGNLTAASIVVAAKGLLRFPELSSRKEQQHVHRLTEYFLVGSFVSWLLALGSVALLAG